MDSYGKRLFLLLILCWVGVPTLVFLSLEPVEANPENYVVQREDVLSVYDGDTFFIRLPECAEALPFLCKRIGVRIEGLDTPERKGLCEEEKQRAALSAIYLEAQLRTADRIELVNVRREKYGRLLGGLVVDGKDVVAGMIASGLARPYDGAKRQGWCQGEGAVTAPEGDSLE